MSFMDLNDLNDEIVFRELRGFYLNILLALHENEDRRQQSFARRGYQSDFTR